MIDTETRRPSPDALLAQARAENAGRLKIYLGAAPGVGKTYAMLSDARARAAEGVDIVAGLIETHGRSETMALCEGLSILPRRVVEVDGRQMQELDVDALLARRPAIALVDELAHTNCEGSRHLKRWMDVEDLLASGIDVWTTLNIQHVESLNDIVARITRIRVRETVPDAILERADEIELIDLTPDELISRLKQGKVYAPDQAARALRNYFAPGNLSALRELTMRRAADRIDAEVRDHRRAQGEILPWAAREHILVCVDERPHALETVRYAKRLADSMRGTLTAAYVETARASRLTEPQKSQVAATMRLVGQLGAETATLPGDSVAGTVLEYVREQNITQIVIGKANRPLVLEVLAGSSAQRLIRESDGIPVHVLAEDRSQRAPGLSLPSPWPALTPGSLAEGLVLTILSTLIAYPFDTLLGVSNLTLIYLAAVMFSALRRGLWAGLFTGLASALAFNWFYTEPRYTFTVADPENVLAITVLSGVAILTSVLGARVRERTESARTEARTSRELFMLARGLAGVATEDEVARTMATFTARAFDAGCVVLARVGLQDVRISGAEPPTATLSEADMAAARWAMDRGEPAGRGASTLSGARWLFIPMRTARLMAGVLAIDRAQPLSPAERRRLDAMADQGANALERAHVARALEESRIETEAQRLREAMLASLSHDLRTPIAAILGAASSVRAYSDKLEAATRDELLSSIETEAGRMQRYVSKLLDMTRLDAGGLKVEADSLEISDVIEAVVHRAKALAGDRRIAGDVPPGLPLLRADSALLHQALFNLVENAIVHGGGDVRVAARLDRKRLVLAVTDEGQGLLKGDESRVFERFHRGQSSKASGVGLGLSIVKGFSEAMGAKVAAANRTDAKGAMFTITFPAEALV